MITLIFILQWVIGLFAVLIWWNTLQIRHALARMAESQDVALDTLGRLSVALLRSNKEFQRNYPHEMEH